MQIKVDCYCGYRGEETPKYILMGTSKIKVRKILDRWLAPDHSYFEILRTKLKWGGATYNKPR